MSKRIPFLFFIILIVLTMPLPPAEALGIGPPSLEIDLPINGSNSTTIYFDSEGVEGKLVIGKEDLPFRIEPSSVNMSKEDNYRSVELTFYGNETLEPGVYEGKVTFVAQTEGFVAVGIKIRTKITLLGEAHEEEPEMPVEEEPEVETEQEPEPEAKTESESEEPEPDEETDPAIETYDAAQDAESAEEPENKSQEMDYLPYVMGVAAVAVLVSVVIWWKRR